MKRRQLTPHRAILAATCLGLLFGAGCGGASVGGKPDDEARAAASRFLDEVRAGRLGPAWEGASTEFKSLMGLENLRDLLKAHPALKSEAEFVESRPEGGSTTKCVFRANAKVRGKSTTETIKVLVAPDAGGGSWKVERLAVDRAG